MKNKRQIFPGERYVLAALFTVYGTYAAALGVWETLAWVFTVASWYAYSCLLEDELTALEGDA